VSSYIYNAGSAFSEIAACFASRPALVMLNGATTTYRDLDDLSNRISLWLLREGVATGDVVAILNCKSVHAYACMIACLKVGVIYVNLDPSSPPERLGKMLEACAPKQLWTFKNTLSQLTSLGDRLPRLVDYSDEVFWAELERMPSSFPKKNDHVHGACVAYIMFTSGSTGFPKGAAISHANLLNFMAWGRTTFDVTPADRLTNLNPMHFDNSVFDFYTALFSGASMVPVPEELLKNPRRMLDALNPMNCTVWFSVPSLIVYALRMRALREVDFPSLRVMSFGGEGFPKGSLRALAKLIMPRVRLVNVYGPTECTCICSSYEVVQNDLAFDELLPLGPVAPNFTYLIVNEEGALVADDEIGELYLGGPNVGVGYYRNPEKSSEVFVQSPAQANYRDVYYRTGDLVRYDAKQDLLFFCGRKDNQVKRMGYRIELEEIENAIGSLSYVLENAVVFVRKIDDAGSIVAHVNASQRDEVSLIDELRKKLPPYMIPDKVVFSDSLPKNQNGKIDRISIKNLELNS